MAALPFRLLIWPGAQKRQVFLGREEFLFSLSPREGKVREEGEVIKENHDDDVFRSVLIYARHN